MAAVIYFFRPIYQGGNFSDLTSVLLYDSLGLRHIAIVLSGAAS